MVMRRESPHLAHARALLESIAWREYLEPMLAREHQTAMLRAQEAITLEKSGAAQRFSGESGAIMSLMKRIHRDADKAVDFKPSFEIVQRERNDLQARIGEDEEKPFRD